VAVVSTADIDSKIMMLNGSTLNTVSSVLGILKFPVPVQMRGTNVLGVHKYWHVMNLPIFVDSENALSWAFDGTTKGVRWDD